MALTLAEAQTLRQNAFDAYQAALSSQSYEIGSRSLTRQRLQELAVEFAKWDRVVTQLGGGDSGGISMFRVVLRDT